MGEPIEPFSNPQLTELLSGFETLPQEPVLLKTLEHVIERAIYHADRLHAPLIPKPLLYIPNHALQVVHLTKRAEATTVRASDFQNIGNVQTELLGNIDHLEAHPDIKIAFIADASGLSMFADDLDQNNYVRIAHNLGLHKSFAEQIMILSLPKEEEMGEVHMQFIIDAIGETNTPLIDRFRLARNLYEATQDIIKRYK